MRIFIADDSDLVRRGVAGILSDDTSLEICGEAKDGSEAIQKAAECVPDLILLDISMPGLNGLEVARRLSRELPAAKILVMSQHDPIHLLPRALEAGADGCIDKARLAVDLLTAIDDIMERPENLTVARAS